MSGGCSGCVLMLVCSSGCVGGRKKGPRLGVPWVGDGLGGWRSRVGGGSSQSAFGLVFNRVSAWRRPSVCHELCPGFSS